MFAASKACASFNGGQLLVRNPAVARAVYHHRPRNLSNTDRLDQDWADALLYNTSHFAYLIRARRRQMGPSFSSCVLPGSFAAECWVSPSFMRSASKGRARAGGGARGLVSPCTRATHHFNCVSTRREKGRAMKQLIEQFRRLCGNSTEF